MFDSEPNPHLSAEIPGSWGPPFKRWILGVGLVLVLMALGLEDLIMGTCNVPVPGGRSQGIEWMDLTGAGARWFGLTQIGFALFLHGRFFWRLHRSLWKQYHWVEGFGLALSALSVIFTSVYLWKQHF